jgi:hypothetical protein
VVTKWLLEVLNVSLATLEINTEWTKKALLELSRPEKCYLVGVREDGKQSDESIFRKIEVFNRLKIS